MEYADGGSLQSYLKENFRNLDWEDKYKLAYQLNHVYNNCGKLLLSQISDNYYIRKVLLYCLRHIIKWADNLGRL